MMMTFGAQPVRRNRLKYFLFSTKKNIIPCVLDPHHPPIPMTLTVIKTGSSADKTKKQNNVISDKNSLVY